MTDNRFNEAVDIVARDLIWSTAENELNDACEYLPDLVEGGFLAVRDRAMRIVRDSRPSHDECVAAYEYLKARTGVETDG